jgi:cysteine synthase A
VERVDGVFSSILGAVGRTPMVELKRLAEGHPGRVLAKLEMQNPAGSIKDRLGVALLDAAERRGLRPGATVIEATGGNTGIGLATACAVRGYRLVLTMPEAMSAERVALLRHLGAEVVLTDGILMIDAVRKAQELADELPNCCRLDQFKDEANPEMHKRTTAVEIWQQTDGVVDVFVSAVGTGGTLTGVGAYLRERNPDARIVAVEPAGAAVLSGRPPGQHRMPGIGVGFVPPVLNRALIDEVIVVDDDDAFEQSRRLGRREGILAGVSAGAAVHAALEIAARDDAAGKTVVVLLADSAERYVTTGLLGD